MRVNHLLLSVMLLFFGGGAYAGAWQEFMSRCVVPLEASTTAPAFDLDGLEVRSSQWVEKLSLIHI